MQFGPVVFYFCVTLTFDLIVPKILWIGPWMMTNHP